MTVDTIGGVTLRTAAANQWNAAMEGNLENMERALRGVAPRARLLDLGCDDGERTARFALAAQATDVHGVELSHEAAEQARGRGYTVVEANLDEPLPYPDASFDCVVSNQVIEHVTDTDLFVSETRRVLALGGIAIISTENLASWHNVGALLFGWQPFSLSNVSRLRFGLGNPLAILRGGDDETRDGWQHRRVFSHRGLLELFLAHRFSDVDLLGSGYYPFPHRVGRLDPRHAAFLTAVARV